MRKITKLIIHCLVLLGFFLSSMLFFSDVACAENIIGSWSEDISLLGPRANHFSFSYGDYLYVAGGATYITLSGVERLNSLSSEADRIWLSNTSMAEPIYWHAGLLKSNRFYTFGGTQYPPQTSKANARYTQIDSDNNITTWLSTTPLPYRLSKGAAAATDEFVYFSGGWTDIEHTNYTSNKVYYAPIDASGDIGAWNVATDLVEPIWGHAMFEIDGFIFIVGGANSTGEKDKVYRASINADGTLGSWQAMPNLPSPVRNFGSTNVDNYIFVAGGVSGSSLLDTIYYTSVDDNGDMEAWQTSTNHLLTTTCCGSLAEVGGYLYLTGGWIPGNYTDKVYRAKLNISSSTPSPLYDLDVEDIKQYSAPWADDEYDQASNWSTEPTIERWGCALTSASMVLKYHGHSDADPDTLNEWLISQPDGYIRNGLVNWLALSRYTREHSSDSVPVLKYLRLAPNDADLINELVEERPAIIKVKNHFVVAKNRLSTSFGINDPAYSTRTSLADYSNTYYSINSYRPTYTDLSYILLVLDGNKNIKVFDSDGNEVTGYSFTEEPLVDDKGSDTSGETLTIFQYPVPSEEEYKIEVTGSSGSYTLESYLYKTDGSVVTDSYQGLIESGQVDSFSISFGEESMSTTPIVTIDSLIDDLDNTYSERSITRRAVYLSLKYQFQNVKKLLQKGKTASAKKQLAYIKSSIAKNTPGYVKQPASDILKDNIEILISSL